VTAFLPIVRSATLNGFSELARELGLDAPALLRQAGLHPRSLLDPQTPLAAETVHRLLEASARASGLSDFGLRLAARRSFASLGPVGLLIKGQPSVGEALHTLLRYLRLLNPSLVASLVPRGQVVVLQEELAGAGVQAAQSIELALGIMHTILRELLGPRWRPVAVHFQHAPPESSAGHENFFGCRAHFRDGFNGIALRPADLQAQPVGGDPGLARLARQVLDGALASTQDSADVVRQLVMALLPGGGCTAALVARHLGVDRRTLHRHLAAQGQSFSGLLQGLRCEWVEKHLRQGQLPLADCATLLGFASQSAFAYWFRSRFGCSVSRWRRGGGPAR
jgi:AraC-like DNA-binding protein